jgi:hypothetical protein
MRLSVDVVNTFPQGFTYLPGRATLDGLFFDDPEVRGNTLQWNVPDINAGECVKMKFVFIVGSNAKIGKNTNTVQVVSKEMPLSSVSEAKVTVQSTGGFFQLGEVNIYVSRDTNNNGAFDFADTPLEGIAVMFEDGTEFVTGFGGHVRVSNVVPDMHVISVPLYKLPPGYTVLEDASRFVKVMEGGMVNVYFAVSQVSLKIKADLKIKTGHDTEKEGR